MWLSILGVGCPVCWPTRLTGPIGPARAHHAPDPGLGIVELLFAGQVLRAGPQRVDGATSTGLGHAGDETLAAVVLLELEIEPGQPRDKPIHCPTALASARLEALAN